MTHPGFTWFQAWQSLCRTEAKILGASRWLARRCPSSGLLPPSTPLGELDVVRGWLMVPEQFQMEQEAPDEPRTLAHRTCKRYHYPCPPVLDTLSEAIVKLLPQLK